MKTIEISANVFENIKRIAARYKESIDAITKNYTDFASYAKSQYLPGVAADYIRQSTIENRKKIERVRDTTRPLFEAECQRIDRAITEWNNAGPDRDFIDKINVIRATGVKMSFTEIQNLAKQCSGNYWSLRCLSAVAEDAGFHFLADPDVLRYEKAAGEIRTYCNSLLTNYYGSNPDAYILCGEKLDIYYGKVPFWSLTAAANLFGAEYNKTAKYLIDGIPNISDDDAFKLFKVKADGTIAEKKVDPNHLDPKVFSVPEQAEV